MFFNRKGINQKNWRMIKKGKHFLFGCTLFLATGAVMIQNPHLVHADEMVASLNDSTKAKDEDPNSDKVPNDVENHPQVENHVKESDKISENVQENKSVEKAVENTVKTVNKTALNELIEKIRNTDLQTKTVKSVENLNLSLSRAQAFLDKADASQDEIDKEVQALSDSFAQLEEKSNDIDKKEKQADKANDSDEKKKLFTEKIAKVQALVSEINQLAGEISYEFSESESKSLQAFGDLSEEKSTDSEVDGALNEAKSLRNKVANRVTRAHSGKRDPRNGKPIDGKGESGFRGIVYTHKENRRDGHLIENGSTAVYYNSDEIWSLIEIKGERVGNERKFTTYARGKVVEDVTPYYIVTVGFTANSPIKGLKMQVAYWDKKAGVQRVREIENGRTEINNPITNAAIRGVVGEGAIVQPGRYEVHIASNTRVAPNQLRPYTFTFIIKPQSERNTVKDLSQTYVDDVRHLTENEKTALIEKFKAEHPDIMKPSGHKSDFERAEISADGTTMTIHFKDGFNPKTIQTNATNDVEAKHSSLTAYFGDSKELYTNPRELVRSKTGHEVPATAQVTYKTPFNLQQAGTRNVVVTTTYQNGVSKDITTPYTVLDFIGKQDKKINQNQSGELGDARNYVTVSNNSAVPGELTVRWKGGSSNVDTSTAGFQHKEIEILRGNHLMKTVNIPVEIVDNINPTITAPDTVTLTRAEGLPTNISVDAQDNARGIGLKDANPIVVENLANPLRYNPSTKRIELSGVIPNQLQSFQATVKAVDKKGNTATKAIRFNVQAQTDKYTAVANPQTQTVSYRAEPSAEVSVNKTGLPSGTTYAWKTKPDTSSPGNKSGVVEVTYPDTSKDTVNVTVAVRKLSDEYVPTGTKIVRNQNAPVTNNDLKASVSVNNNGNSKVKSVTASPISTVNAGTQTIRATVTYLDDTTDTVTIPLEVKDVIAPTIQTPSDRQNWDLIALDRTLPSIRVSSVDNNGGTGVKSTTITGLPDFLVYDDATKTIKFKNGVQEVTKLPVGQDSKIYNATIQVTDNSNNSSQRQVTITVKSMTTKFTATPNGQKQTVSYGEAPDAGTSVNKNGLPTGTAYTWATTPSTTTGPGDKSGVVTVTYPDGSKDTVNVTVAVRKLSDEYAPTGTKITREQNTAVTNDDLKAAVTISNNGNNKVKSVTPVGTITTVNAGTQTIRATVTYLDNTTDPVDIPLEVKDETAPTIQTPNDRQNWDLIALDRTLPSIKVTSVDNNGGTGVKSTTITGLPDFLVYDDATKTIKFKNGVQEVTKLPVGQDSKIYNATIQVTDNSNNSSQRQVTITVKSMTTKYTATPNSQKQTVSYGEAPDAGTSVNKTGLPEGTSYAWKTTPSTTTGPGDKSGVVTVTYPDDSIDTVNVTINVRRLADEYAPTGTKITREQNTAVTNDDLKAAVTISNNGNNKVKSVTPVGTISTAEFGNKTINATVTYLDDTIDSVTIPLEVRDVTKPTIQAPTENQLWEVTSLDKTFPSIKIAVVDNAGGSGVKSIEAKNLPSFLKYDKTTSSIVFQDGVHEVPKLSGISRTTRNVTFVVEDNAGNRSERNIQISQISMAEKYNPQANTTVQELSHGETPNPKTSVNTEGLPGDTRYVWKTTPDTSKPGDKTSVVTVTYPDDSVDEVTATVKVRKLSDEYNVTGAQIEVNQNDPVTNDDLKAKVTATSTVGNVSGTDKISTVTAPTISTASYGNQTISATVTFKDGTTKEVTIPLKVKDVTKPTISAPTNGQNWDLIAVEGENPNIAVTSEDNAGGSGVKTTTVTGLPDFLEYNESTKKIQFKAGVTGVSSLPEGANEQPHNVAITVVDNAGNEATTNVTITVKSMTTKYEATANPDKQTVSYGATPDAGTSVSQTGLPEGTSYAWKTTPVTTDGPGEKDGVVEVTYKDGSKDTVDVKVTVKELSSEYEVSGSPIEVNQNTPVTNDDLKAKVTATSTVGDANGTDKISTVTVPEISTANYGEQNITATVTFKDGTTKEVTIPLKVKDVTNPTISAPTNGQNWNLIAVEGSNPEISVTSEDNTGGSGVKSTTVTGLPDFLEYNESTKKIQFKAGVSGVPSLPEGTNEQPHNVTITVVDNAGNETTTNVTITVKSMTTKYEATANPDKQTVSYGATPDAGTSVNQTGLPEGTSYAWKTTPVTTTPGEKDGVVEVTYKDGSKDTVDVKVTVKELSSEYEVTGAPIEVNQNDPISNDDLKAKVTATSKVGNVSGTDKISTVTTPTINTANYGDQSVSATVTFKDGTTKEVTIPLKVKDVTNPTISAPTNGQNWDLIAVEGSNPEISVTSEDNTGGSGVKTTTVTGLPYFLEYNDSTKKILFKEGVTGVPSLPEGTDVQPHNVKVTVADNAGNEATTNVTITVKSMTTKYEATANPDKQTVSYGATPDAGTSVNKTGLPEGTSYAWKARPVTTDGPGEKVGVVEVTYKDGSKDIVNVKVTVKELSSEYEVTGATIEVNQNTPVTNDDLKAKVTATSTVGNVSGTDKISTVTAPTINTANYGEQNITATVTFKDGTTKEVTIPLKVKDVTKPTISAPTNGQNWDLIAVEGENPNIAVTSEDNAGGSGVKTTTVTGLPDFLEYNESTKKIQFKAGVSGVPSLSEGTDVQPHNVTITVVDNAGNETTTNVTITVKSMTTKYDANPNPDKQTVSYGETPDAGTSVNKTGLPEGTSYAWKTTPSTTEGAGDKAGVVTVTYPDGSKDTVDVKVTVKELSSEYEVSGAPIEVNQNIPVTNDDLKAKVTATSKVGNVNGTDKISTVTAPEISTANYGEQNITATVTFKDGTTKPVTIPLKVKDVTKPTIQSPAENTNWEMTALDKALPNMEVRVEDNANGSGIKNVSVTGLPDYLEYDSTNNTIKFKSGKDAVEKLPENTPSREFTLNIRAEDNAGNVSERAARITVSSMSAKNTPTPIPQNTGYGQVPDPNASVDKAGLPDGTMVTWKTPPAVTVPGTTTGLAEVTYPDGSKDTVEVTVNVSKLSDEYNVTATEIVVNQNTPVTNDDLKAKVTATSTVGNVNGTDKISTVTAPTINTANYGEQNITATVTFKDGTTKEVMIPLKVKDVTKPTISAPAENTNWEMTALDKALPNMEVRAEDNENGSGIKNVTVTGLPDYLEYDSTTNAIKFKSGKQTVEKLAENTPSQEFTLNIRAEDKAGNISERTGKITVSSMSAKTNPTPIPQNKAYGQVPDPNASVDKAGLPDGTKVTWKTPPVVNTPGTTTGVAEVTYPDGSKDVVTVNVTVRKVSEDFTATGTQIEVNQNVLVTPEMLKGAVTATNAQGENGNSKIATVESKTPINTEVYGDQTIQAKVTYIDGSEQDVTIPLKVKDVTDPTIQTPAEHTNWEMTALDKTLPPMKIEAKDNANGSGIATIEVRNMPSFLTFDQASGTIVFKEGVREVPRIYSDNVMHGVTIVARDKAGNSTSILVNITVWSMRGKYSPTAIAQEVDNGHVPDPETSVNKTGLPEGTRVTWKDTPVVNTPGSHPGVALVHYPDGTEDEVTVPITVKEQKETFNPTAKDPAPTAKHGSEPSAEGSINTENLPKGTTYTWVEKPDTNTTPGSKPGKVLITYPDHSTEEVPVTVEVTPQKDDYDPQPKSQTVNNGTVPNAEDSVDKTGLPSGTRVTWKTTPVVDTPGDHPSVALVTYPDGTVDEVTVPITVKEQKDTFNPTAKDPAPTAKHGSDPSAEGSINTENLPKGTTYTWVEKPDTNTTPGSKPGKVLITYPDKSTEEVTVTVEVTPQKDDYDPQPKAQTVDNGTVPKAEDSVNKTGLPIGTTVTWKTTPDVSTPGAHPTVALVTYPDGTIDEVTVPITVKEQKDTFNPTAKEPDPTAKHGSDPSAEGSINTDSLPKGTTYTWVEKPDTNTTPGNKPGKVLIIYPDKSTEEVTVTVEVTPQKDDYDPQSKPQTMDNGHVPDPETSVNKTGLPEGTRVTWKTTPDVSTPGAHPSVALVTYPDGTIDEVTVPITVKEQKDTFNPTAKEPAPTAKHGSDPSAEGSINTDSLPKGTTYTWVEKPDTNTTPGNKPGKVLIIYPDKSTEEVTVTVEVTPQKDDYDPQSKPQTMDNGHVPDPETSVNKTGLPEGTRVTWKTTPDVSTPGAHPSVALVTYPDGTVDEVTVPITVKEQKDTFNPTAKDPAPTAKHGSDPSAEGSINTDGLPSGTTYTWVEKPDTSKPGSKTGKVLITYPDKSTEEVSVTVNVTPQNDEYTPTGIAQTVDNGHVPKAEDSVDKTGLPSGTTITWKETPVVNTPGAHPTVALVTYPDGTEDEVTVPITVKEQKDTFNPTAKEPGQTAKHGSDPSAEGSINTDNLPKGTTYTWVEKPDTNTTPGSKPGKVLITYPDKSTEEVTVTVEVTPQKDDYDPQPKAQTVDNGTEPNAEDSVDKTGLPSGTTVTWKDTPVVNTPGSHPSVALVHYPDGTIDEVTVPITVKEQKETFNPTAKEPGQKAKHGSEPSAEGSINTENLPKGTTYTWVEKPDTNTTPGSKPGKVLITYPDKSTEEVTVTVEVTPQKDDYDPQPKAQTVDNGTVPKAEDSVDKTGLPSGTTVTWKDTPVVNTPGSHPSVALVHYPDGTTDEVTVPITVKEQKETFNPTAKEPNQTVRHNEVPNPETSINTNDLPAGTNYSWSEQPDTSKPGSKPGKVLITYPDNSTEEVNVTVEVTPQKDDYDPQPKPQTMDNGTVPNAEDSVDKTGLPSGTRVTWKTTPDVSTPGAHPTVALVTYPDGTTDEVTVPITVKEQKDTFNPTAKDPAPTAKHGSEPSAEGSINTDNLPKGTTYTWVEKPDTNTTPGSKSGKVLITYPDKSTEEVTVTVEVTPQKDDYDPQPKAQTVEHAQVPLAKDSIHNVKDLPEGSTFEWKDGKVPDTSKHGEKKGVVTVTYQDRSTEDVEVTITVNPKDFTPVVPKEKVPVKNPDNLTQDEQDKVKENVKKANPGKDVIVASDGNVTITDSETNVSHNIPRDKLVFAYAKGEPETSENPEFNGGVNAPDSPIHEVPEFAGGVNGEPEVQPENPGYNGLIGTTGVDENGNLIDPPTVDIPEFHGAVNGELPDPVQLPKVQLIITKWVDENGNELRPADAKAPTVLGEANEAYEHGEIEGYVFVRTETKGDVVTHVFRKVSPVRPTGDGQQRPTTPSDDTNPRPDTATPAEGPTTQPAEQPSQTVEVPAQLPNEVSETNPSVSQPQAVLPNTGTKADRATGALGALSLLGAFGLLFAKKKKDDEEEA